MATDRSVKKLSSGVLDMKFMLRTKKKLEAKEKKKKDVELQNAILETSEQAGSSTTEIPVGDSKYTLCNDYTKLESLEFGRMSFKGYNKEIEKLMLYYERLRNGELSDDDENDGKDVNDAEMAEKMGGSLAKKFASKRERQQAANRNAESTGPRLNFSDIRKRAANDSIGIQPERKFMKPSE
ncbi:unnamed protein product [Caenorhabditis bovis]|uniref:M-phase phosphoprotein 6 n=1 Tax=Caenorhabditis bovis TaxID=2654633 RepID=A0A8S1EYJ5_9PELO|nr:unnamed protein product [Caenorhabditis bovis]